MNKIIKKVILISILLCVIISIFHSVKAATLDEMEKKAQNFIKAGKDAQADSNINYNNVTAEFKGLGQILTTIGAGVMVGITTYMGIKYLTAGPEAQAKLKTQLVGVLVSGIVIFGAYSIWKIVINIASTF